MIVAPGIESEESTEQSKAAKAEKAPQKTVASGVSQDKPQSSAGQH